jgi:hypothetical protein
MDMTDESRLQVFRQMKQEIRGSEAYLPGRYRCCQGPSAFAGDLREGSFIYRR